MWLLVALGERYGAEVRVLRCVRVLGVGAWCQWPRGAWIILPSPHHVLLLCCLLQGPQVGQELQIELLFALGECHGAEVRMLRCVRVLGVGGVVPMATGGVGLRAFTAS